VSVFNPALPTKLSAKLLVFGALSLSLASACTGKIEGVPGASGGAGSTASTGSAGSTGGGATVGTTGSAGAASGNPNAAGPMPMLRLTNREYNNTVRDLLGDTTQPANQFASDRDPTFEFRRAGDVAVQDATLLRTAAEGLATAATPKLVAGQLLPCDPASTGEPACAAMFISTFGRRAFRRPVAADEATRLTALYTTARTSLGLSFTDAIGVLVEAMLQAPQFLYHWELAPTDALIHEGSVIRLGPYQVAARLSYFVWGSMPDDMLLAAAAAGQLDTAAGVQTQARRLLADPRAKDTVSSFFYDWIALDGLPDRTKDTTVYPGYTADVEAAMVQETSTFVQSVAFGGDGRLATLLGAPYSYLDGALAKEYGATATGTAFTKTSLDPTQRAGLMTQGSFLALTGNADGSNPVRRGKFVYTKLLCNQMPPPPANVPPPASASAGGTTRQRFEQHDQNACAKGCHTLMDPIGFAFENYDGIGQWRTMDNGLPVDATGSIGLDGKTQTFNDAIGLTALLAQSPQVRSCFSGEWSRYALARVDTPDDAASLQATASAFAGDAASLQDLIAAVATMRSFRYRSLSPGETP
jgi:Protein of unknown function (DUF1592)/Protein of unknown function (DUF1588)/Protein of unknown function (DUF1595)/Protein of unknown function (DUF1585)/Protein of unknown function (DUF1587)